MKRYFLLFTSYFLLILTLCFVGMGCASRKITIKSEPPGAKVIVDGKERGLSPCTFQFTYYGSRQVILEKDGYQTLKVIAPVKTPFIHIFPFDLLLLLIPYPMADDHVFSYPLTPAQPEQQNIKEVVERGKELKKHLRKRLNKK